MRAIRLVRIAMEAEALRLRYQAQRTVTRLVIGCFAFALLLLALVFAHVAAWFWLREALAGQYVALIFAGIDLLLAAILALVASRSTPGPVELGALAVRRQALDDVTTSLTVPALLLRLIDLVAMWNHRR